MATGTLAFIFILLGLLAFNNAFLGTRLPKENRLALGFIGSMSMIAGILSIMIGE